MLNEVELQKLMVDLESDLVERTVSVDQLDKFSIAACAFANDLPNHRRSGYLFVGINDQGKGSGLKVTDQLLRTLGEVRANGNILPIPSITVSKLTLSDGSGEVATLEVKPSELPPVRYKGQIWIRVRPRRALATEQEERQLTERRVSHARTFDGRPCLGSTISDLATDLFLNTYRHHAVAEDVIIANHRELKHQMAALRFYDLNNDCPTNAGILLFAKNPRYWLPGAYLQFLRFSGTNIRHEDILMEREIHGDLLTILRELESLIDSQIVSRPIPVTTLRERTLAIYPSVALRELVMNAVMHRDYEGTAPIRLNWFADRIEVQNPGSLYGEASRSNFLRQTSYRNPIIAEAMKTLGFVNRYGAGIERARRELLANGNREPKFLLEGTYFHVTIQARQ